MNDLLPEEVLIWRYIENTFKKVLDSYGYNEIRFPIIENTSLFKRAFGKVTDIIEKEMYSFEDRRRNSLTLRPEGTAGCVRTSIEHHLYKQEQRLWYIGPMFRYERPQKGRYRQFYQLGVEVFGLEGPDIDTEIIVLIDRCWKMLNIGKHISLEINSIGSLESRFNYCNELIKFLEKNKENLDSDCRRRMYRNPLRILDSKNTQVQKLLNDAPKLNEYLDNKSKKHFFELCNLLEKVGITYTINHHLVRGLDYYNRTVFEFITNNLGSKGTVCAGGRYDGLIKQLGGNRSIPAIGFALGIDRLVLLIQSVTNLSLKIKITIDVYLIVLKKNYQSVAIKLAEYIRDAIPNIRVMINYGDGNLKRQLSRASKKNATVALIIGKPEVSNKEIILKELVTGKQIKIKQDSIIKYLKSLLKIDMSK